MGRSFKLKPQSNNKNNNKTQVKEEKQVKYDHRPVIKTNLKILEEFKKNMSVPSELWDSPYENPFRNNLQGFHSSDMKIHKILQKITKFIKSFTKNRAI